MPLEPRRSRFAHGLTQNLGLWVAAAILAASLITYVGIYYAQQHRLPGNFEVTTTVNNTMPLAFAGVAQTLVVLTRGIDLWDPLESTCRHASLSIL